MTSDAPQADGDDEPSVASTAPRRLATLEQAYHRHAGAVFELARRVLTDRARAEDVTEAVFVQLWSTPQRMNAPRDALRWSLLAACHDRVQDVVRRDGSRPTRRTDDSAVDGRNAQDSVPPGAEVAAPDARAAMATAIDRLPVDERLALSLTALGDRTHQEVAVVLQTSEDALKSEIRRALQRLGRGQLGRRGGGGSTPPGSATPRTLP